MTAPPEIAPEKTLVEAIEGFARTFFFAAVTGRAVLAGLCLVTLLAGGSREAWQIVVGALVLLLAVVAISYRRALFGFARDRPRAFLALLVADVLVCAVAGYPHNAFGFVAWADIGLLVAAGLLGMAVALTSVAVVVYVVGAFADSTRLWEQGQFDLAIDGAGIAVLVAAILILPVRAVFVTLRSAPETIEAWRDDGPPSGPLALAAGPPPPKALTAAALTPAEQRIVNRLALGQAPKEIAVELGLSIHTVRTHIKRAKRKTGSRTLPELARHSRRRAVAV